MLIFILLSFLKVFAVNPEQLKFTYMSFDGENTFACTHQAVDEFYFDWDIFCFDQLGNKKKQFRAHVALSHYQRQVEPMSTYEVLYWVNEPAMAGAGSSQWFHFKNRAEFHSLMISQSVEKDLAGLYLEIKP